MANLKDTIVLGNLTVTGKINGKFEGAEVSVVNNNPTLAWNTTSTVGTISGTAIQITMPANPNTYLGYPAGFNNRPTSITWGTLATGHTYITRWDTSNGGSVAFAQKQDSSRGWQTHMQIDGFFYQNEGANKVLDTSNVSGTANKIAKFTATNTIGSSNISDDNTTITLGKSVVVRCSKGSYNEGIRITPRAAGGWSNVFFSDSITDEGTHEKGWLCGKMDTGNFTIEPGNSNGSGLWLPYTKTNRPKWNNNELAYLSDCKNPTDYYWANIKISSSSSTTTVPTFAYIRINDDSKVYTGANTWGTADVDTYYYSRGIKASNYTYSFPRRSGYFIVNQSPNDSTVAIGAKVAVTEGTTTSYYNTVASGTQSIAIGAGCEATGQYSVAMGYLSKASNTYSMAFGRGVVNSTSGRAQFGTTSYRISLYSAGHSSYSDIRNKTDVEVIDSALDFINDLTPITYRWNPRSRYAPEEVENFDSLERPSDEQHLQNDRAVRNRELVEKYGGSSKYYDIEEHQKGTLKDKERQAGLSAQDIYDKLQKHYGTEEYANILSYGINENATLIDVNKASTPEGCTIETELSVNYEMIIPFLIRAIQEQQQQIDALKEEMRNEKSST